MQPTPPPALTGKNFNNINFFRIFFTLVIVYGHIIQHFMMPMYGHLPFFEKMSHHVSYGFGYMCDMFFIISGFFMFFSFQKHKTLPELVLSKVARLTPVLLVSLVGMGVLSLIFPDVIFYKYQNVLALLFLDDAVIANFPSNNGAAWYINILFWGAIFYFFLLKAISKNKSVLALIVFFAYTILLNKMNLYAQPQVWLDGLVTIFMLRGIAGMGLGYLIGDWYNSRPAPTDTPSRQAAWGFTLLEGTMLFFIFKFAIRRALPFNFANMTVCFIVLFFCFLTKKGHISQLTDRKIIFTLGKYCFSIYMMQEVMFCFLKHTFWQEASFVAAHPVLTLIISMAVICALGLITYYAVEKPAFAFCKEQIKKRF